METKHTKGEWSVDGFNTTSVITNINGYTKICDCHLAGVTGNDALQFLEENKANAKLIAAAPELLEALIEIIKGINPEDACYGKFAHYWPEDSNEYKIAKQKAYVGSKSIPSDEQILMAINAIKKATE